MNEEAWLNQRVCVFDNIRKNGKAYIFVTNEYTLDEYPQEQVECNYKISIMTT